MRWPRKTPYRWKVRIGFPVFTPFYVIYAESFQDALDGIREIEWGFTAADAGEPGLDRTIDLDGPTQIELEGWVKGLESMGEKRASDKTGGFTFGLGDGYYTKPSGKQERMPLQLSVGRLSKNEIRELSRAAR